MADSSLLTVGVLKSYVGDSTTVGTNNIVTSGNIQAPNFYVGGSGSPAYISYNSTTGAIEFNT